MNHMFGQIMGARKRLDCPMRSSVRIHFADPKQYAHTAEVVSAQVRGDRLAVILRETIFHPDAGGQPNDLGTINDIPVEHVAEEGLDVVHFLGKDAAIEVGSTVNLKIDAKRRQDHSQQHTGQHIISRVLEDMFDAHTSSFHLPEQDADNAACSIDLSLKLSAADLLRAEAAANELVQSDAPVESITLESEATLDEVRKSVRSFPEGLTASAETPVRIVRIRGFDTNPCCGTHVGRTGEVGYIKIVKRETSRGGTRVSFVSGARAVAHMAQAYDTLTRVAAALTTGQDTLLEKVDKMQQDLRGERRKVQALVKLQAERAAAELAAQVPEGVGSRACLLREFPAALGFTVKELRQLAVQAQRRSPPPSCVALATAVGADTVLVLTCGDGLSASNLLSGLKERFTCRGGGNARFGTATVEARAPAAVLDAVRAALARE
eukprot:gnl/Chilomastix_cuspidata/1883.p1 GENE.gnl/Chilomastix_cuspidata/1883~~gnl/Chilomastix_cuspidata/1883.p1  ORF type:complete len:436 (+),score=175.87 gnl/Chilomastix_cuspidata/1883:526-1833(+)